MIPYTAETTPKVPAKGYKTEGSINDASRFGGAGGNGGCGGGSGGMGGAGGATVVETISANTENPTMSSPSRDNASERASPFCDAN